MTAAILKIDPHHPEPEFIKAAALTLQKEGLVAFPTETVYGLGALASSSVAVNRVYQAKSRPLTHPLIAHVSSVTMAQALTNTWPSIADLLTHTFWPGPLTLILNKNQTVSKTITAGREAVAIRMPAHPVALALIQTVGEAIVAPSANLYTEISPTQALHVSNKMQAQLDLILDAGACMYGLESTVLDLTGPIPTILRPGAVSRTHLEAVIGTVACLSVKLSEQDTHACSGQSKKHYAPRAHVALVPCGNQGVFNDRIIRTLQSKMRVGAIVHQVIPYVHPNAKIICLAQEPVSYAQHFYDALHQLEYAGCSHIILEEVPQGILWDAVRDRMTRAGG